MKRQKNVVFLALPNCVLNYKNNNFKSTYVDFTLKGCYMDDLFWWREVQCMQSKKCMFFVSTKTHVLGLWLIFLIARFMPIFSAPGKLDSLFDGDRGGGTGIQLGIFFRSV